jgi:Ca2+-binding EF-hand superfamily protein
MNKMSIVAVMIAASVAGSAAVADRDHGFFGGMFGGGHHGPQGDQMGGMNGGPDGDMAGGPGGLLGGMLPDFTTLDADANGQITTEELDAAQAARFATADANTDGGLSADEIIAQIEARRAEMMAARAQRMIEEKDANADGLLQAEELLDARAPRAAVMFAMLDTNEDGSVDQAEFDAGLAMMAQHQGRGQRG